jgi:hypothetical protein
MMSDFRGRGGGSKMTIEGKNLIKGGKGVNNDQKNIGHHLCMIPKHTITK